MNTAIGYVRKSTVSEGRSLREQEADLRGLAERHGMELVDVVAEEASAYAERVRPKFTATLKRCEEEGHTLLTWSIDRFSRRGAEEALRVLPRKGSPSIRLVTLDGIDSADPRQRLNIIMQAEWARDYSDRLAAAVNRAKTADRAAGKWLGGFAPYGFTVSDGRKLVLNLEQANVLRRVVEDVLAGETLLSIARALNAEGVAPPGRGRRNAAPEWAPSTLSSLLRNPVLCGWLPKGSDSGEYARGDDGGPIVVGEALLSPAERRQVMDMLATRLRPGKRRRPTGPVPKGLLARRIFCGRCKSPMATVGGVYRCAARMNGSAQCPGNAVQRDKADAVAITDTLGYLTLLAEEHRDGTLSDDGRSTLAAVASAWAGTVAPEAQAERRRVEAEVANIEAEMADLRAARYVRHEFDGALDQYEAIWAGYLARRDDAVAALAQMPPAPAVTVDEVAAALLAGAHEDRPDEERRRIALLAIQQVQVMPVPHRGGRFNRSRIVVVLPDAIVTGPDYAELYELAREGRRS